jgi:hypothetical protein
VKRTQLLITLGLVLWLSAFAHAAFAGPIITVSPSEAGPINCSDSVTFAIHYNPNDYTGDLARFSIDLTNGAGDYITFDTGAQSTDVTIGDWTGGFFGSTSAGVDVLSVDGATFGGDPLAAETEADLFFLTVHGAATGMGELHVADVFLENSSQQNITPDALLDMATVEVDCTAPDAPVINPLPTYSAGTAVTVSWSAVADGVDYYVTCDNGDVSGWITDLSYEFTGLAHNTTYCFTVMARDDVGNEGGSSGSVCTTMDNVMPESACGPLDAAYATLTFTVPYTASDDMSGVQYVELYYTVDGGPATAFGTTFDGSPIDFVAPGDGEYCFYTVATDNAGNVEADPAADAVCTIVDTTPPDAPVMDPEPPYTAGTENTVSWGAVADAADYQAECDNGADSGWIPGLEATFTGLTDATTYGFRVRARDGLGNVGDWSDWVYSTQDATDPESEITAPPSGDMLVGTFDIFVDYSDATSGVAGFRLFYKKDDGTWTQYNGTYTASPVEFVAPGDGMYWFYTIAEDNVGNVEAAPPVADLELRIDTAGPGGTFVINGGDEYTTTRDVVLNIDITDANGVDFMRFSEDGDFTGVAWTAYATEFPWSIVSPDDGEKCVYAQFMDGTTNVSELVDCIILDTMAPSAVTVPWYAGTVPGHESVTLNWTEDEADTDLALVEIWAALWDDVPDDVGTSTYPEFDDIYWSPSTTPVPPTPEQLDADGDFFLVAVVPAGEMTYVHSEDSPWARGSYSYYFFARDLAGNYSGPQANWPSRCINYIAGDFNADGVIGIGPDVSPFAYAYGAVEGDDSYNNEFDIGPLAGRVPSTDNMIQFEDLMVLADNFDAQGGTKAAVGDPETPVLTWYPVDELTWALGLVDPCNSLKGLRLAHDLPENATVTVTPGAAMDSSIPYLLANDAKNGLDLGFAILGQNQVMPGNGELLRVTTSEPVDLSQITLLVRDATNKDLGYELTAEPLVVLPSVYKLADNYPNPFNPETTIKFALPEAQDVRMEIFDIKGHRVRVLVDEAMAAGNHSVVWNGRDKNGRVCASGTYFYRVQAGPLNETRRMLLVK